jgi:uroporphyrinogen-III synthase
MAILVTRPVPDNAATLAALKARGYDGLSAPMLRFEAVPLQDDPDASYGAVIVTSANALRAIEGQPATERLLDLPLFAVGDKTAEAARGTGFTKVFSADGDAAALRDLIASKKGTAKRLKAGDPLLYLAGADLARDLAGELGARGFTVITQTTYRMAPIETLASDVAAALSAGEIAAVLHYSRRSARAFIEATRGAGVEITALGLPQCCLSDAVAAIVRDAGASQVLAAPTPDEQALLDLLDRNIGPASR